MRYFKRHWNETRGDEFDSWGQSWWYFQTDDSGNVIRQMEEYAEGQILRFDSMHVEDIYGGLAEKPLDLNEFQPFEVSKEDFEKAWSSGSSFNRASS